MKPLLFAIGILLLIGVEIARVYFIMPFPGSQVDETIFLAYFIQTYVWLFRFVGWLLIAYPSFSYIRKSSPSFKFTVIAMLIFWAIVVYAFNFRFLADKMFYQPEHKILARKDKNKVPNNNLVIGVSLHGESKAYPIENIGYHHQVRDSIGGEMVMITYCTVCRTGRAYSPIVDGQPEIFRLVGMDHFNAMFEDGRTKSWWRQANGEAIVGPLKGKTLREIPSEQMTLGVWLNLHPDSFVLQPDSSFKEQYKGLEKYDEGKMEGKLERHDSLSWHDKSWVVGVAQGLSATAYDWNDLLKKRVINDVIENEPIVIALEADSVSFHAWSRIVGRDTLQFGYDVKSKILIDQNNNLWNWAGENADGSHKDAKLNFVQAYQEYWHSWRTFHPQTKRFGY
ncbi:MAG: DUF3179 domain-containing protein [Bacteroidetes bacterium]|nr:DUF3179 domain-containing protein [Bacteroidota bacterium]